MDRLPYALCLVGMSITAGVFPANAEPTAWFSEKLGAAQKAALADYVAAQTDFHGITGLAVAVLQGDEVLFRTTAGFANVERRSPVHGDTLFQLSSSTKLFTGTLMAMLAAEGRVRLDASIREYLPGIPEAWSGLQIVDLMGHVSGLPEVLECGGIDDRDAALTCVFEMERPAGRRDKFIYNQTNYLLAQMIIESVTGRPFAAALQDYILSPAGMSTAVLNGNSADELAHRAASYYPKEEGGIEPRAYDFPPFLTTAAGLNASLDDMIAFARALERGTLLDDLWKQAMWRVPMLNNGERSSYALGWDRREVGKGQATFGHEGGSLTTFRVYPHAGLSIIVLTNGLHSYFGLDGFADALALAVEPDILDPADAIAYRGKMLYARDGIDGTDRFLREALQTTAISDADGESIVLWLADELADSGRSGDAVRLLTSGIDAMPDSAALKTEREKLGSAAH